MTHFSDDFLSLENEEFSTHKHNNTVGSAADEGLNQFHESVLKSKTVTDNFPDIVLRCQHKILVECLCFSVLIFYSSVSLHND